MVYSNCCCRCSFEPEIIKIGQSYHKMYSNNILNFQEFTPILNVFTKKVSKLVEGPTYIYIYIYIYIYNECVCVCIVCWLTVVEGETKAPFSIASLPRSSKWITPFFGLIHLTLIVHCNAGC